MNEFYLPTHEWARSDGASVVIGLSPFAAGEVGDIIHVELPAVGTQVVRSKPCAEIESVKSVNDFYCPIDGVVAAVNDAIVKNPELVNSDPLAKGWFVRITPSAALPFAGLMSAAEYQAKISK